MNTHGVELLVQFDTRDNVIANNVLVAGPRHAFIENVYEENVGNTIDYNLYFSVDGSSAGVWRWKGVGYDDFDRWSARSGNDRHSIFADPGFVDPAAEDFSHDGLARGRRGGVPGRVGRDGLQRSPPRAGRRDRPGGIRGGGAPALADPVDPGAHHLRGQPHLGGRQQRMRTAEIDRSNGERAPDDGGPIVIGTSAYDQGIGAHAPSRIVVELDGQCSLFLADVGLDEEVGDRGSVVFEVWGDGARLAVSGIVRGPQAAVPIAADLEGVSRMELVVKPGGDGNAFDHADWGNARLACLRAEPSRLPEKRENLVHRRLGVHAAEGSRRDRPADVRDRQERSSGSPARREARNPASNASPAPVASTRSSLGAGTRTIRSPWAAMAPSAPAFPTTRPACSASARTASSIPATP